MNAADEKKIEPFAGKLVLASSSPRRIELLTVAGYQFRVVPPGVEESSSKHLTPRELSMLNARRKAHAVAAFLPNAVVIGADTVVAIEEETLGKPLDLEEAWQMIQKLSGKHHQVVTSVWVLRLMPFQELVFSEVSTVKFRRLDREEIFNYLSKIDPLDKAGGYAAQEYASDIIEGIDGSRSNVIGLPMETLAPALKLFQLTARSGPAAGDHLHDE